MLLFHRREGVINVEFTIRFLHPAEAVLILFSNKVDGVNGATMTFSLKAEVKNIDPLVSYVCMINIVTKKLLFSTLYQNKGK